MTSDQRANLPEDEEVTAADRLIDGIAFQHRADHGAGAGRRARPDACGAGLAQRHRLPPAAGAGGRRIGLFGFKRRTG